MGTFTIYMDDGARYAVMTLADTGQRLVVRIDRTDGAGMTITPVMGAASLADALDEVDRLNNQ